MSKFNFLKKKAFAWFEKKDASNISHKSDELSQPKSEKSRSEISPDDKAIKRNRLLKKILIWILSLGIIAAIVAPIVVSCTRQTEIALSDDLSITYNTNNPQNVTNSVTFTENDGLKRKFTVEVKENTSYLSAYYRTTSNQLQVKLKAVGQTMPILVNVYVEKIGSTNTTDASYDLYGITFGKDSASKLTYSANTTASSSQEYLAQGIMSLRSLATTVPSTFNWVGLIVNLLPTILIIAMLLFYFSYAKKMTGGQESIFSVGKSNVKAVKTTVKFTDVAGIDEVSDELKELVDYVQNPSKYAAMGARAPKGVILYGPPGTGKTLIAKAVAGEANCNFFATSGSAFEDMLVGVGAKRVRDLFARARKNNPSIIFIDEIDSVASKRGKNDIMGGSGIADQTINQLLAEMDGFTSDSGVIIIAATNRLDVLDEAILRPGRFDRQIQVTLPDIKGREAILKIHSKNKNISSEVNLLDIARRTPGFSGAQLENVLNEAAILAVRNRKIVIKMSDIDEAIDRVIGGPARHGRVITEAEKKKIAYHEGGHALVGLHSKNTEVVQKITIIPRGDAAGYTMQTPAEQEKVIQTKEDLLNQVRMTLGGRAAEEVIYGSSQITTGAANDLYKVSQIVKAMVLSLGMSKMGLTQFVPSEGNTSPLQQKMFSETTARELDLEIEQLIQIEYKKAKEIIKKNRKELELIVETLLVLETIVKDQIDYIHKHKKLPAEVYEMRKKTGDNKTSKKSSSSKSKKMESDNLSSEDDAKQS